jgi:hypothetical protein
VEKLATKRKMMKNLEISGTSSSNSFVVLNCIDDDILIQTASELDIKLVEHDVGSKIIISTMKAEEKLSANIAEASYLAHLESLKHKECVKDDDGLDLAIIDNSHRDYQDPSNQARDGAKKRAEGVQNQEEKMKFMFWNVRGLGKPPRRQVRELIEEERLDGIGLQETIKVDFTNRELMEIAGSSQFRWIWQGARGQSGGILVGASS